MDAGRFRHDLYYRLHVIPVKMPALRERAEDIELLSEYFLDKHNKKFDKTFDGFDAPALSFLENQSWAGTVRELENMIKNAVALNNGSEINADMFTLIQSTTIKGPNTSDINLSLEEIERNAIENAIQLCNGSIPRAAALLKVSQSTLYRKKAQRVALLRE